MPTPFDENPIGSHRRNLYGEYRSRYNRGRITEASSGTYIRLQGWTYIKMNMSGKLHIAKHAGSMINRIKLVNTKAWVGTPQFYMTINDIMVYPWSGTASATLDTWVNLTWDRLKVRTGEELEVWVRSTNANDGIANDANVASLLQGVLEPEDYTDFFV